MTRRDHDPPPEWVAEFNAAELGLDRATCEVPLVDESGRQIGTVGIDPGVYDRLDASRASIGISDPPPVAKEPSADADPLVAEVLAEVLAQIKATLAEPTPLALHRPAAHEQVSAGLDGTAQLRTRVGVVETALQALVARVERCGGYASPEEQDVLHRARLALAGGGLR